MHSVLQQLNLELGQIVEKARRSLVQVRGGDRSVGAGSIWHADGLIVTNAHVIGNQSVTVCLPDGSMLPARLLAQDERQDIAALSVDAAGLPTIDLGESRNLLPGEWVMALGHPLGVSGAAVAGVVIGSGRDLPETPGMDRDWIAVSLSLRPGHSGGPLVDAQGRLVGINTLMAGPEVGMAVPVHVVKEFLRRELGTGTRASKKESGRGVLIRIGHH
jgi:serine protease Do